MNRDRILLVGTALLVCVLGVGTFQLADTYHVNPLWIVVSLTSVIVVAVARGDYREQFRSPRFVAFVCGWVVINAAVIVLVLGLFGWLWLLLAMVFEQFLFYESAYRLFGVQPRSRKWPFQR